MLNYNEIKKIKHDYLPNTRIMLDGDQSTNSDFMPGTRGTIKAVDDFGQISVLLDNGVEAIINPEKNKFKLLPIDEQIQEAEVKKEEIIARKQRQHTHGYQKKKQYHSNDEHHTER